MQIYGKFSIITNINGKISTIFYFRLQIQILSLPLPVRTNILYQYLYSAGRVYFPEEI